MSRRAMVAAKEREKGGNRVKKENRAGRLLLIAGLVLALLCAPASAEASERGMLMMAEGMELPAELEYDELYIDGMPADEPEYESGDGPSMPMVIGTDVLGNEEFNREEVRSIYFLDSLSGAPSWSWDVSANRDGSVRAWMDDDGEELYIAADGGVIANPNCAGLFEFYTSLEEIDFAGCFDTSRVEDMSAMFESCSMLEEVDLSDFDTSNVRYMAAMFSDCTSLREVDLSSFDTRQLRDMSYMFAFDESLEELDLSSFETPELYTMMCAFFYCSNLRSVNLKHFDTSNLATLNQVFEGCPEGIDIVVGDRFVMK